MALYITGLAGGGTGYFVDQNGAPRLVVGDTPWGLIASAGQFGGTWQSDIDTYVSARAGQGYTALEADLTASTWNGNLNNESTWDGVHMFTSGGDPSTGLNDPYWQRADRVISAGAANGITLFANPFMTYDFDSPRTFFGKTATQIQDYGTALGNRYKNTPNLIWMIEDDYFGNIDSLLSTWLTAVRATGDTHPIANENYPESTSRKDLQTGAALSWGAANDTYQWVYSYNVAYFGVEEAYKEASPIPVLRGDGDYYNNSGAADEQLMRNHLWWALSSGSRGFHGGDNRVWPWSSTTMASVSSGAFQTSVIGAATAAFAALPGWYKLIPDTSNVFITAGRGTRATSLVSGGGGGSYSGTTDAYVSGSVAPDGSLAVIYCSHHGSITIDQTKMAAGYTAQWMDPATGTTTAAAAGATYDSTSLGNNSAAAPDWVLILQGPLAGRVTTRGGPAVVRRSSHGGGGGWRRG